MKSSYEPQGIIMDDETTLLGSDEIPLHSFSKELQSTEKTLVATCKLVSLSNQCSRSTKIIFGWVLLWVMLVTYLFFYLTKKKIGFLKHSLIAFIVFVVPMLAVIAYIGRQMYFILG